MEASWSSHELESAKMLEGQSIKTLKRELDRVEIGREPNAWEKYVIEVAPSSAYFSKLVTNSRLL